MTPAARRTRLLSERTSSILREASWTSHEHAEFARSPFESSARGIVKETLRRALPRSGGPPRKMSQDDAYALYLFTMIAPDCSRPECVAFLRVFRGINVSVTCITNEWHRLRMSRKLMKYYSEHRDEESRISWWINPPDLRLPRRLQGIAGVPHASFVDIDEAIFYYNRKYRRFGHAPVGERAKAMGAVRHDGER